MTAEQQKRVEEIRTHMAAGGPKDSNEQDLYPIHWYAAQAKRTPPILSLDGYRNGLNKCLEWISQAISHQTFLLDLLREQQAKLNEALQTVPAAEDWGTLQNTIKAQQAELEALRKDQERLYVGLKDCFGLLEIALRNKSGAFANAVAEEDFPRFENLLTGSIGAKKRKE